jgi:hypothetical protein
MYIRAVSLELPEGVTGAYVSNIISLKPSQTISIQTTSLYIPMEPLKQKT